MALPTCSFSREDVRKTNVKTKPKSELQKFKTSFTYYTERRHFKLEGEGIKNV